MLCRTVPLGSKTFSISIQKFENGCFISVTEGANRLGTTVASVADGQVPATAIVIPSRDGSLFVRLLADQISARMRGIALVSAFTKELEPDSAKRLMTEILEMIDDD